MPFIPVNGCDYYYESHGDPNHETILFSHGVLWSGRMFWKQVEFLKSRYHIITYDHRGQGQSSVTGNDYGMDQLYLDAAGIIEGLGLKKVHFAGLSMGGFVGMRLAARRPDLVQSLILMETSAEKEAGTFNYHILTALVKVFGVNMVKGPVMKIMFGKKFLDDKSRTEEKKYWVAELLKNKKSVTKAVYGIMARKSVESELKNILCPVLIIVGTQDMGTVPARAEFIHKQIPHSVLKYAEGAGHTSTIEEPEQVNSFLEEFLVKIKNE